MLTITVATFATNPTFAELWQRLYADRYTGSVTVHCLHGMPQAVEVQPEPPVRIVLEKAR